MIFPCLASNISKISTYKERRLGEPPFTLKTKQIDVRKQANVIELLHHFNCKILVQWHSWESLLYSMHAACTQKNMFSQKKRLQLTTLLLSDSLLIPEPHNLIFIMLHWVFQTTFTLTSLHFGFGLYKYLCNAYLVRRLTLRIIVQNSISILVKKSYLEEILLAFLDQSFEQSID